MQCAQCGKAGIQMLLKESEKRGKGGRGVEQQVGVHEVAANAYGLRQLKAAAVEKVVQTVAECECVRVCVCASVCVCVYEVALLIERERKGEGGGEDVL